MHYEIQEVLMKDEFIQTFKPNIQAYVYPDHEKFSGVHIVIDPIMPPKPADFADGVWVTEEYFYFIEVWSQDDKTTSSIARAIQKVLNETLLFRQFSSGVDEYDRDYGIFRDMRKYRGKKNLI